MDKNHSIPEGTLATDLNSSMPFGEVSGDTSGAPPC